MTKPPYDRATIIGVVEWLTSHPDIKLSWHGYDPPDEDEWVNPLGFEIDGEDALAIIADPVAFNAEAAARKAQP